jgi:preprotein translocase subunit SecF
MNYRINFLKYRHFFTFLSLAVLAIGIVGYVMLGGFKYHIDFSGGAEIRIGFEQKVDIGMLRQVISNKGWHDAAIQSVGSTGKDFIVRVGEKNFQNLESKFKSDITSAIPGNNLTVQSIEFIGAEVEKEIKWNATLAVLFSMLAILLYLAFRSRYDYAIGAIVAMGHDLLIMLAFLVVFQEPVSLNILAAILAVIGYSVNDTIVVFGRIQENFKKMQGISSVDLVNLSINQTLSRTLLTSFATLLAVTAFLFLGGETLRGFSIVLFIGIVVGTYSSIYIASPVMLAIRSYSNIENK